MKIQNKTTLSCLVFTLALLQGSPAWATCKASYLDAISKARQSAGAEDNNPAATDATNDGDADGVGDLAEDGGPLTDAIDGGLFIAKKVVEDQHLRRSEEIKGTLQLITDAHNGDMNSLEMQKFLNSDPSFSSNRSTVLKLLSEGDNKEYFCRDRSAPSSESEIRSWIKAKLSDGSQTLKVNSRLQTGKKDLDNTIAANPATNKVSIVK